MKHNKKSINANRVAYFSALSLELFLLFYPNLPKFSKSFVALCAISLACSILSFLLVQGSDPGYIDSNLSLNVDVAGKSRRFEQF